MSWPLLASTASLVFCLLAFLYFRSYIKKRTGREAILSEIREEVNRMLARIDEITEQDVSLLEEKEKSLRGLLEEIDKRVKVYTGDLERSLSSEKAYRELGKAMRFSVEKEEAPLKEVPKEAPNEAPKEAPLEARPKKPVRDSLNEQIRELARSGLSAKIIASRLGISISEAEMAVALLERRPF
jgi:hypothetical protein